MTSIEPATIGLIGFGALARQVFAALGDEPIRWIALVHESSSAAIDGRITKVTKLIDFIGARPDLVVEAAGQESVASYVPALLEASIPVVIASIGALADTETVERITKARRSSGAGLIIPSGAIGGLDYLAAIARLPDVQIRYRLRKPLAAWHAELEALGLSNTKVPITLFEGTPTAAARLYPKNLNAAFTVALTVQPAQFSVAVIADPDIATNIHEIETESAAGKASFRFANAPSPDNPKTSAVTALSVAASVRNFLGDGARR
jgi:aspartate dehydrogenase